MVLAERILKLVEYSQMSIPKFSEFVGFRTPQAVRELIKGNTKSLSDAAQFKLMSAFPGINRTWLLTGEGDMFVGSSRQTNARDRGDAFAVGAGDRDVTQVDFVPVSAHATFVENLYVPDTENLTYPVVLTSAEKNDITQYKVFEVEGESMSPSIPNGALILAKEIPERNWHYAEGVAVVVFSEFVVIKRIEKNDLLTNNLIVLSSDNERYGKLTVQLSDIRAIYKARRILSSDIK